MSIKEVMIKAVKKTLLAPSSNKADTEYVENALQVHEIHKNLGNFFK